TSLCHPSEALSSRAKRGTEDRRRRRRSEVGGRLHRPPICTSLLPPFAAQPIPNSKPQPGLLRPLIRAPRGALVNDERVVLHDLDLEVLRHGVADSISELKGGVRRIVTGAELRSVGLCR